MNSTQTETVVQIPIAQLRDSPYNPRQIYDRPSLDELATDIKTQGVQSPVRVRVSPTEPDALELVFGHRRKRAAELAGLTSIPAIITTMTDIEVKRAQISENLQRKDVHPIEEAEGFQALMQDHGVTANQLVEQTGKSRAYIYGRLALLKAVPKVREACLKGEIGSEVALLLARLRTEKLQTKALSAIDSKYLKLDDGGYKSFRQIRDLLREKFTLDLTTTMFDCADVLLLPDAGACTTCPKRVGNAPEYSDLVPIEKTHYGTAKHARPDTCTDPDCFEAKTKAHLHARAAELQSQGKTVVDGNKARAAIGADGKIKGDYVPLAPSVKAAIKKSKAAVATVVIQDPRTGKTHEAVQTSALVQAGLMKQAESAKASSHKSAYAEQEKARQLKRKENEAKAKRLNEVRLTELRVVREHISKAERTQQDLFLVARTCLDGVQYTDRTMVAQLWECSFDELRKRLGSMNVRELNMLIMDCVLVNDSVCTPYDPRAKAETLHNYIKWFGLTFYPEPTSDDGNEADPEDAEDEDEAEDEGCFA